MIMTVDPEELAAAVFLKEPIWNPRHAGYKNKIVIQQCWSDLSKQMIVDDKYNNIIYYINLYHINKYKI